MYYTMPPYYRERGCNVHLARAVKQCPDIASRRDRRRTPDS
jgi:hypothetical protein